MKGHYLTTALIVFVFVILGCSKDDNPAVPNNTGGGDEEETGTVVLFSADFETAVSGWDGVPLQRNESTENDYNRSYPRGTYPQTYYQVSVHEMVIDDGAISVTSAHAYNGSKSLMLEHQVGVSTTIDAGGYYYNLDNCESFGPSSRIQAFPIRKFSLLDYTDGDKASVSLMVKPLESALSSRGSSIDFKFIIFGAHGPIETVQLDHAFMEENRGKWVKLTVDLSSYTGWENDIGIVVQLVPVAGPVSYGYYCWQYRRGDDLYSDVFDAGETINCMLAIDDLKLTVVPAVGR